MRRHVVTYGSVDESRRRWLVHAGALIGGTAIGAIGTRAAAQADTLALRKDTVLPRRRIALVIGNATYTPQNRSILCSVKNVADVSGEFRRLGFEVSNAVDQTAPGMRGLLKSFFTAARSDASAPTLAALYYSGHGIQYRGKNFLVPSDVPFNQAPDRIAQGSVNIDDEIFRAIGDAALANGDFMLVFDACRTDPTAMSGDRDGQNQVVPPRGTVISFATAPGKPAIAPVSPDQNSFYTAALLEELRRVNAQLSLKDFLEAVKFRVSRTMRESSEAFLRTHAQDPEVAANLSLRMSLATDNVLPVSDAERRAWDQISATTDLAQLAKLLTAFVEQFDSGPFGTLARVRLEQVNIASRAAVRVRIEEVGDAEFRSDQLRALIESDKYAALRVAQVYERGAQGVARDEQKMLQWLRHASGLSNGIASYALYRHYLARQIDREAVRFRKLAIDQGYTPPPELDSRRG